MPAIIQYHYMGFVDILIKKSPSVLLILQQPELGTRRDNCRDNGTMYLILNNCCIMYIAFFICTLIQLCLDTYGFFLVFSEITSRCCIVVVAKQKKVAACPALSAMRTQNYCKSKTPSDLLGNTGISATRTPNCPGQPPSRGKNLINSFISIVPKSFCVFSLVPLQ